jgi:hypothetical protein
MKNFCIFISKTTKNEREILFNQIKGIFNEEDKMVRYIIQSNLHDLRDIPTNKIDDEFIKQFMAGTSRECHRYDRFIAEIQFLLKDLKYDNVEIHIINLDKENKTTAYKKTINNQNHQEMTSVLSKIEIYMLNLFCPEVIGKRLDSFRDEIEDEVATIYDNSAPEHKARTLDAITHERELIENLSCISDQNVNKKKLGIISKILRRKQRR